MKETLLSELEYVTPKTIQILKKNNIITVSDLLLNFPNKFDDYTIVSFDNIIPDTNVTVSELCKQRQLLQMLKTKLSVMNFYVDIEGHKVRATIFNRHFLKSKINYGVYVRLTGKFSENLKKYHCFRN